MSTIKWAGYYTRINISGDRCCKASCWQNIPVSKWTCIKNCSTKWHWPYVSSGYSAQHIIWHSRLLKKNFCSSPRECNSCLVFPFLYSGPLLTMTGQRYIQETLFTTSILLQSDHRHNRDLSQTMQNFLRMSEKHPNVPRPESAVPNDVLAW